MKRLMVVGAHPDDCELTAGGLAIKVKKEIPDSAVMFVSMTNGDAGHYALFGERLREIRYQETRRVAQKFGLEYVVMDAHDGYLEPTIERREALIRVIRDFMPDLIVTHHSKDYHPDHRNTSQLVSDSAYLLQVPAVARDVKPLRYLPSIWYNYPEHQNGDDAVYVDITPYLEQKAEMAACHVSQFFDWLPWVDGEDLSKLPTGDRERLVYMLEKVRAWGSARASRHQKGIKAFFQCTDGVKGSCVESFRICEHSGAPDREFIEWLKNDTAPAVKIAD